VVQAQADGHPLSVPPRLFERPILVAEIGGNHGGDRALAEAMVEAAVAAGASAIKFQAYRTHLLVHPLSPYHDELASEELDPKVLSDLLALARRLGAAGGLSVFDLSSLALAESAGADFVKLASGDLTFHPLLARCARSPLPLVLSTGASTEAEVAAALRLAPRPLALLQCCSAYPAPPETANLAVLAGWLAAGRPAGLSDHVLDLSASIAATRLGAVMIERHLTIDRSLPGGDNAISSLPEDFRRLRDAASLGPLSAAERAELENSPLWGRTPKAVQPGESPELIRRVAVAARDLKAGEMVAAEAVAWLRPPPGTPAGALRPDYPGAASLSGLGGASDHPILSGEADQRGLSDGAERRGLSDAASPPILARPVAKGSVITWADLKERS
jgi:N-acetylneuraminate synthase/N,N'-diacetyllegionaminate synthase